MSFSTTITRPKQTGFLSAIILILFALGMAIWTIKWIADANDYEEFLSRIPLGSDVSWLVSNSRDDRIWGGEVVQWISMKWPNGSSKSNQLVLDTNLKEVQSRSLGDIRRWNPEEAESESFSGVVTLYMDRQFEDSVSMEFTFLFGRLVKKKFGFMPG